MTDQWFRVKDGQFPELDIGTGTAFTLGLDGDSIIQVGPDRPNPKVFILTVGSYWADYTDLDQNLADIRAALAEWVGPDGNFYWVTYGFREMHPSGISGRFGVLATARQVTVPGYLEPIGSSYREVP